MKAASRSELRANGREGAFAVDRASLDEWVRFISKVYFDVNKEMKPLDLWMQVVNDSCILAEHIRKGELDAAESRIVKMFGWIASFVGKYLYSPSTNDSDPLGDRLLRHRAKTYTALEESYGKWILEKYPSSCSKCGLARCHCAVYRKEIEERKDPEAGKQRAFKKLERIFGRNRHKAHRAFRHRSGQPNTNAKRAVRAPIDRLVESFVEIYGSGHYDADVWKIAAHLQEEVGEVALELVKLTEIARYHKNGSSMNKLLRLSVDRKKQEGTRIAATVRQEIRSRRTDDAIYDYLMDAAVEKLKEELADVFTWLTAMLHKISDIRRTPKRVPLSTLLKRHCAPDDRRAVARCPACLKPECDRDCLGLTLIGAVLVERARKV